MIKAVESGIIDVSALSAQIELNERKKYLNMHYEKFSVWQGKDGKYYTYLPDSTKTGARKKVKKSSLESVENAIVDYYKKRENNPLVRDVFNLWIDEKLEYGEIAKQTYDKYKNSYIRFFQHEYYTIDKNKIAYVTEDMLERFIKTTICKLNLTVKAYSEMRILINGIFKYAKKKKLTDISITNFMGDLQLSKNIFVHNVKSKDSEVFLEDEIPKIKEFLEAQGDDIHSLGLLLVFQTGMRVGELAALKISDVNTAKLPNTNIIKNYISIERTEIKYRDENNKWVVDVQGYPKTEAGIRNIIVGDEAMKIIARIRKINPFGEYLFMYNGKRIRGHAFNKKLGRVCKAMNINKRTMHKIRKTYGTTLLDNDVDDALVAEQMGHKDVATTRKYYYYSNKSDKTKIEQINKALECLK